MGRTMRGSRLFVAQACLVEDDDDVLENKKKIEVAVVVKD